MLPFTVRHLCVTAVAAKPAQGRPRRFAEAVGCADCPAMLPTLAWRTTRYARFARCARTDAPSQKLKRAARAARLGALLGASQAHRRLPCTGFAGALVVFERKPPTPRLRDRRHPAGAISAATRSTVSGSARAARFVLMLAASVRAQRAARSELRGTTPGRAPQCSRREAATAAV